MPNSPNIFIIGTAKAATSSLAEYLSHYTDIFVSSLKEPHYWSEGFPIPRLNILVAEKNKENYSKMYDVEKRFRIDASTSYICSQNASSQIGNVVDSKVIMIVRDPVDRYISHYRNDFSAGVEFRSLQQTIIDESLGELTQYSYFDYGKYGTHLKRWLKSCKKTSFLCIDYDALIKTPNFILPKIMDYLGVTYDPTLAFPENNPAFIPRNAVWGKMMRMHKMRTTIRNLIPKGAKEFLRKKIIYRSGKNIVPGEIECREKLLKLYRDEMIEFSETLKECQSIGEFSFIIKYIS